MEGRFSEQQDVNRTIQDEGQWPQSSIIWQNLEQTVTVLDIPHSIELAQQFDDNDRRKLLSTEPIKEPYTPTEPKSKKALAALPLKGINELIQEKAIQLALDEARQHVTDSWCLERTTPVNQEPKETVLSQPPHLKEEITDHRSKRTKTELDSTASAFANADAILIPPGSEFIQSTISAHLSSFIASPAIYSLVLLDPPWPNRSVSRSSSYATASTTPSVRSLLASIPLEDKLGVGSYVGVWITNKPIFRDLILGTEDEEGLFEQWGVSLVEEWVWLKVTENGQPVTPIEGVWRKPYEILLIGQRQPASATFPLPLSSPDHGGVKRRIIIAVPDLHSRKPNLKELFESTLLQRQVAEAGSSRCLEIFARNLTAGWTSWGDEVLKFQGHEWWNEKLAKMDNTRAPNT